jgi:hypothetical protein
MFEALFHALMAVQNDSNCEMGTEDLRLMEMSGIGPSS